jgi:GNAT superfamily N-acetyltransferase
MTVASYKQLQSMAGFILELDPQLPPNDKHKKDLEAQAGYAASFMQRELKEAWGYPIQAKRETNSRYLLIHSPEWKKRYGIFQFRFKIVDKQHIYIDQLYVPKSLQQHGIGTACGKSLIKLSEKLGKQYIYLWSVRESESFWERLAFELASDETWDAIMNAAHNK